MKRSAITLLGVVGWASVAVLAADPGGNGVRHRNLVLEAREARAARTAPPAGERGAESRRDADRGPPREAREPRDAGERRPPGFAGREGRRDDDGRGREHRRDDERRDSRDRGHDRRWDDRHRDDRRWDDRRWDDKRGHERRWSDRRWDERSSWRDARGRPWRYEPRWYQDHRLRYFRYDRGHYYARERFHIGLYVVPRGYSYRVWRIGDWLPYGYYDGGRYALHDYWRYRLYDPPYWAMWIRVRDDALLVDVDTGEVIDVVYDLFW